MIHVFGSSGLARGRRLLDLVSFASFGDPAGATAAYYAGDRRGPRISFRIPGGGTGTVEGEKIAARR